MISGLDVDLRAMIEEPCRNAQEQPGRSDVQERALCFRMAIGQQARVTFEDENRRVFI